MKILWTTLAWSLSFSALATDDYVPPSVLSPKEAQQARIALEHNAKALNDYWLRRLEIAKTRKKQSIPSPDAEKNPHVMSR